MSAQSASLAISALALMAASCAPARPPRSPPFDPTAPRQSAPWGGSDTPAVDLVGGDPQSVGQAAGSARTSQDPLPHGNTLSPSGSPGTSSGPPLPDGAEAPSSDGIEVEGGVAAYRAEAFVRASRPELYRCAREAGRRVRGRVVVLLDFDADGAVRRATLRSSEIDSPRVEACILRTARDLRLDNVSGRSLVSFTLRFDGSG